MDPIALAASLTILGAVLAGSFAIYSGGAARTQVRGRLEGILAGTSVVEGGGPVNAPLRETRSVIGVVRVFFSGGWAEKTQEKLSRADSNLQPMEFFAIRFALTGVAFAVPFVLLPGFFGLLAALGAAFAGFQLPSMWLNNRVKSRARKLEEQLPEALTLISNSLKAGFGLLQSLSLAADQLDHPIATELAQTIHEMNVGSSVEEALLNLNERAASYDLDLVVTAILVQRSVGGNLSEILETVAETMRERVRIRGEITTLTAQQQLTGVIIALLPVGVGLMFMLVSPGYINPLFTETVGKVALGAAVLLETVGVLVIRRILDIEV
jgi:tight adherence protein B